MDQQEPIPRFCQGANTAIFYNNMVVQMWRVNALLVVNAILMGVMVSIGTYGHRNRRHPLTRLIFQGATTLFLPTVSYVVSTIGNQNIITVAVKNDIVVGRCDTTEHISRVLVWTGLVQIVGVNTVDIVASDAREGRNIAPPVVLLVQALWTSYLAAYNSGYQDSVRFNHPWLRDDDAPHDGPVGYNNVWSAANVFSLRGSIILSLFTLIFAKIALKSYAWYKARQSFALGRNPRLIVAYMKQVYDENHTLEEAGENLVPPPPLIVMGEDTVILEKESDGYSFKRTSSRGDRKRINCNGLVTLDKVWQLDVVPSCKLTSSKLKDVCFSLALFKLLRCRFSKYTIVEAGLRKPRSFLWSMLLQDGDNERVLELIQHELSLLHDCYFSSLPISYSKSWLPLLSIFISLISIGCCVVTTILMFEQLLFNGAGYQMMCLVCYYPGTEIDFRVGNLYFDLVPVFLLFALVLLTEVREIASYIYSSWTKVALICSYARNDSWLQSPTTKKCVGLMLQHRCKLLMHWENKINQSSILVIHGRRNPVSVLGCLISLRNQSTKKVSRAVKTAIMDALRRLYDGSRSNGITYLPCNLQLQVSDNLLWPLSGATANNGTADIILVCHIGTSIFEARSHSHQPAISDHKTAAVQLSRYCVYLVAHHPEFLPDSDEWCKSLYKTVKKDAACILPHGISAMMPDEEYQSLVQRLGTRSEHEVLKNGARLGRLLLALTEEEEVIWGNLAHFWSEVILCIAASDSTDGHAEAISRGGELITLVWALVAHLGIARRPDDSAAPAEAGSPVAV